MSIETVQLLNEGFKIVVNVKKPDGTARDLTGATNLKIKLKSALSTTGKTYTAQFEGSPSAGSLSCVVDEGDIDCEGVWQGQAYYELTPFKGHTLPEDVFFVRGNLA